MAPKIAEQRTRRIMDGLSAITDIVLGHAESLIGNENLYNVCLCTLKSSGVGNYIRRNIMVPLSGPIECLSI